MAAAWDEVGRLVAKRIGAPSSTKTFTVAFIGNTLIFQLAAQLFNHIMRCKSRRSMPLLFGSWGSEFAEPLVLLPYPPNFKLRNHRISSR
jgi:hypothetical protein